MRNISAMLLLLLTSSAILSAGCVSAGRPAPEEPYIPSTFMSRWYRDIDKDKLLKACELALTASDHDYRISGRGEYGFDAERRWIFVSIIFNETGKSFWNIELKDKDGGQVVTARSWSDREKRSIPPFPVDISAGPDMNHPYSAAALYKLYFERVDYILGLRQDWPTCKDAKNDLEPKESGAELETLCAYGNSSAAERLQ
jgi:hypothetical protein